MPVCRRLALSLLPWLACACSAPPPPPPELQARDVTEVQRYELRRDGQRVGWLSLLQIDDPQAPLRFYRVENLRGQWLGHATLEHRFSRRVPFRDDEEDLGLYPMAQGVARLLDLDRPPEIVPWQPAAEASAPKEPK